MLVVIAIISILTSVVIAAYQEAKGNKKETEAQYCKELGNRTFKGLPAKCVKYFLNSDERKIYVDTVGE